MYYTRTESIYKPPNREWALQDAFATARQLPNFRAIAELGDADEFAEFILSQDIQAWRDFAPLPSDGLRCDRAEQLARRIWPVDPGIIRGVFQWDRRRSGLFVTREFIEAEAERLRKRSNAKGAA